MASFGSTAASVFDVVTQTSNAVVASVNTVSGGMSMLNDFVTSQRNKQSKRLAVELIEYDDVLLENAALDALKREESIKQYTAGDIAKQESYKAHYLRIEAAVIAANKPN